MNPAHKNSLSNDVERNAPEPNSSGAFRSIQEGGRVGVWGGALCPYSTYQPTGVKSEADCKGVMSYECPKAIKVPSSLLHSGCCNGCCHVCVTQVRRLGDAADA